MDIVQLAIVLGPPLGAAVVSKDGVRDDRGRGHAVIALNDRLYAVAGENLKRGRMRRPGEGMRILADI